MTASAYLAKAKRASMAARPAICMWSSAAQASVFQRDDNDLHCEMPISFVVVVLGGEIEIPTLDGSARIKIRA